MKKLSALIMFTLLATAGYYIGNAVAQNKTSADQQAPDGVLVVEETYGVAVPVQAASPQRDPSQELVSYLQPILERAISDRLSTVIDAAARSAADAAADRIRSEVLSKIDLIVRDAVEHETSRFLRMRR